MTTTLHDIDFLLDDFRDRTPGVAHAIGISADGLLVASTSDLPRERGDQLAAIGSGLTALLAGAARCLEAGTVMSNLTELSNGFLLTMSIDSGASLVVLVNRTCDIGHASYEMGELIRRVGPALTPDPRSSLVAPAPGPAQ